MEEILKNTLFIHHHLGLGDHIVCNGMVRFCMKHAGFSKIRVVVKKINYSSVFNMFRDDKNIEFETVNTDDDFYKLNYEWNKLKLIRAGFEKIRIFDWAESLYDSAGISFNERWDSFYYKRDQDKEKKLIETLNLPKDFILVHKTASIGELKININTKIPIVYVSKIEDFDIFSWLGVVEKAKEVHCIDSSFLHLVESFKDINKQLFYHNNRNSSMSFQYKQKWNFINY